MTRQSRLLAISAAIECLAGMVIAISPAFAIAMLFHARADDAGIWLARLLGVSLFALGIACWGAVRDEGVLARAGTLSAITLYNAGAGLLLTVIAAFAPGPMVVAWVAGIGHLALAAAFFASRSEPVAFWRQAKRMR